MFVVSPLVLDLWSDACRWCELGELSELSCVQAVQRKGLDRNPKREF
jgi:hypothetical protein